MTKLTLLMSLYDKLSDLSREDVEERLNFYSEMIEDRMEEGLTEEEAVAQVGSVEEIVAQIKADLSAVDSPQIKVKPKRRMKVWEIVLLTIGSPVWLSLLIAAFAVLIAVYVVLWAVVISLWAVFGAFVGCALGIVFMAVKIAVEGNAFVCIALIGAAIACAGLSIFLFFGSRKATKAIMFLSKWIALGIKKCFVSREEV